MVSEQQLTLAVALNDEATFANFYAGEVNQQLLSTLQRWLADDEQFLYLYGPEGSGCSHLLQAVCQQAAEQQLSAQYLPLRELLDYPAEALLDGLEQMHVVCIDDLAAIGGNAAWEEALFHLFNRVKHSGCKLLVASHVAPRQLPLQLPDLQSRLQWGVVYRLEALDDAGLQEMLLLRAQSRGLVMSSDVAQFIVLRAPRQPGALLSMLDILDVLSLQQGRKLTIPFVKNALNW